MIKAVLFDLDQTLINFIKMKTMSLKEAVNGMIDAGLEVNPEDAYKKISKIFDRQGWEGTDPFQVYLKEEFGNIDYRILAYGINAYRRVKLGFMSSYPGTKRTLIKLKQKNLKLAIITDAPRLKAWLRLTSMRIDDFFDFVITFDDTGERKPHKLPFEAALEKLNLQPNECLMVGDNPARDIDGAKAVGMQTCLAKYGQYKAHESTPDFTIEKITDLPDIIQNTF